MQGDTTRAQFLEAARAFEDAANRLSNAWYGLSQSDEDALDASVNGSIEADGTYDDGKYPFINSFDEVAATIGSWVEVGIAPWAAKA